MFDGFCIYDLNVIFILIENLIILLSIIYNNIFVGFSF